MLPWIVRVIRTVLLRLWLAVFGKAQRLATLKQQIKSVGSYAEWQRCALEIDRLEGYEEWKNDPASQEYDYRLLRSILTQLRQAREDGDKTAISFLLRTSLTRNMADLGNPDLYSHSRIGTKKLVHDYTSEIVKELQELAEDCSVDCPKFIVKSTIELFKELKHSYGNTALLLSGGGSLGTHHIGVMKALFEQGLLPKIICGSSSGALMAAFACTRCEDDYEKLMRLEGINIGFLEEPEGGRRSGWMPVKLSRLVKEGVLFDSVHLGTIMRENIGDITFLEAFQKTARVLNITVSSPTGYEVPRLINYLTAPHAVIWSAAEASCAVPGVFGSRKILAKDPKTGALAPWRMTALDESRWVDGSLENDLPMRRLAELFNVNHCIVSQVNPHVYPFLQTNPRKTLLGTALSKLAFLVGSELRFRLSQLSRCGFFPHACHRLLAVMGQTYVGDITIVPDLSVSDVLGMLAPSTPHSVQAAIAKGERAAWPYLSMVHNRCAVELELEKIIYNLKCRLIEEPAFGHSPSLGPTLSTRSLILDADMIDNSGLHDDAISSDNVAVGSATLSSPLNRTQLIVTDAQMVTKLTDKERSEVLPTLHGWQYKQERDCIEKTFMFESFSKALGFMVSLGVEAQAVDHHPEMLNVYNRVVVVWTTHDCQGLSRKDTDMAAKCDALYGKQ